MHGIGFDMGLQEWFDFDIPQSTISPDYIYDCLQQEVVLKTRPTAKAIFIGQLPLIQEHEKKKKGMRAEIQGSLEKGQKGLFLHGKIGGM